MSYKKYGGSVQCRRHATLSAVGGVLQGFTPVKKKLIAGGWFRSNVLPVMSG